MRLSAKYKLVLIYFCVATAVILRILATPNGYTTGDSLAYLEQANEIKQSWDAGNYSIEKNGFITWPLGYPTLIAMTSQTLRISPLVASKIVNLIFLAMTFVLFAYWFKDKAWFPALFFFSYGSLEIYSHTWSEAPFLFFLFFLVYWVQKESEGTTPRLLFLYLFLGLSGLFLLRYVGIIYLIPIGLLATLRLYQRRFDAFRHYTVALLLSATMIGFYMAHNLQSTGFYFDPEASNFTPDPVFIFLQKLSIGLANELTLARNHFYTVDYLYWVFLALEVTLFLWLLKYRKLIKRPLIRFQSDIAICFGLFYLIAIIVLSRLVAFDDFDYRILAPFSFLVLISLFHALRQPAQQSFFKKSVKLITGFMILSLIINLPKRPILDWFNFF